MLWLVDYPLRRGEKAIWVSGVAPSALILLGTLGITSMDKDAEGMYNVKIGFDGYNGIKTKRWPNGQPNQMVARAIESGTTWMRKNRFVSKAVSKTKKQALAAMQRRAETEIKKIMK